MEDERWDDSGRQTRTEKRSGSMRQKGKRRQQKDAYIARVMKIKGHVREEALWIPLWLQV